MVEQALGIPISWPEPVKYGFHFERYAQVEFRPRMGLIGTLSSMSVIFMTK